MVDSKHPCFSVRPLRTDALPSSGKRHPSRRGQPAVATALRSPSPYASDGLRKLRACLTLRHECEESIFSTAMASGRRPSTWQSWPRMMASGTPIRSFLVEMVAPAHLRCSTRCKFCRRSPTNLRIWHNSDDDCLYTPIGYL